MMLTDPEVTKTSVTLHFRNIWKPTRSVNLAAFRESIIRRLVQEMINRRLDGAMTDPETTYFKASATIEQKENLKLYPRHYSIVAFAVPGKAEEALVELLRTTEAIRRHGFHDSEIASVKDVMIENIKTHIAGIGSDYKKPKSSNLEEYYLASIPMFAMGWWLTATMKMLPGISAKDINTAVKDYFGDDNILVGIFAPELERCTLPSEDRIRQLVTRRENMTVERLNPRKAAGRFLSQPPKRGRIISETVDSATGSTIWELSNGMRVILHPTKNTRDDIALAAIAKGGTSCAAQLASVSRLAVKMWSDSGLGPWSNADVTQMLASKQVSLDFSVEQFNRCFEGGSAVGDLQILFELIHLHFDDPKIDPEVVKAFQDYHLPSLLLRGEDPETVFKDECVRIITNDHPRYRRLMLADFSAIDIDEATAFLQRCFNPADFTFAFVGSLKPKMMRGHVETYLASIPCGKEKWNTWTELDIKWPGNAESIVFAGLEDRSIVQMTWYAPITFSEPIYILVKILCTQLERKLYDELMDNDEIASSMAYSAALDLPLSRLKRRHRYIDAVIPTGVLRLVTLLLRNGTVKVMLFPKAHSAAT